MIVLRLLAVFMFTVLLTGCLHENVAKLKGDIRLLKLFLKEFPPPTLCGPPSTPQNMICNYRLVVKNIEGNLYRGHVDPKLVKESEEVCKLFKKELAQKQDIQKLGEDENADLYKVLNESECPKASEYRYFLYEFEVVGEKPKENVPQDFINVAHTNKLKLGHIGAFVEGL